MTAYPYPSWLFPPPSVLEKAPWLQIMPASIRERKLIMSRMVGEDLRQNTQAVLNDIMGESDGPQ